MLAQMKYLWGAALLVSSSLYDVHAGPTHPITQLVHQKRFAEAIRTISERQANDPNDAFALAGTVDLIVAQNLSSRFPEARAAAERCVDAHPTNSVCAEALGNALEAQANNWMVASLGNTRSLRDAFERAVLLDPSNYRARVSLLRFYLRTPFFLGGSTVRARELAMEVNRTSPDLTRLMLALCAFSEERLQDAEEYILAANLRKYELVEVPHRDLLYKLAVAHLEARRYADSSRLFVELHRRIPTSEYGSVGLALVARAQGRLADAATFLERAAAIGSKPYVYKSLGEVYQAQNNTVRAIAAYQAALSAKPALERRQQEQILARLAQLQQR